MSRPRKQKVPKDIGPSSTFGTQSVRAKRGVYFRKILSKTPLFFQHRDRVTTLRKSKRPPQRPPSEPSDRQISSESLAEGCAPRVVTLRNFKKFWFLIYVFFLFMPLLTPVSTAPFFASLSQFTVCLRYSLIRKEVRAHTSTVELLLCQSVCCLSLSSQNKEGLRLPPTRS